jgi:hypothetical protein
MAITTIAGAIAGAIPPAIVMKPNNIGAAAVHFQTQWYGAGSPPAAPVGSAGMAGEALTTNSGAIPWSNPASGNSYLMRSSVNVSNGTTGLGSFLLVDRLWQQSGIDVTVTTAQTIDSVAWPARDINASTNGAGVWIALEVSTVTGAGAAVPVIEYTNSGGTGTRTGTCSRYGATAAAGRFFFFELQAGDVGVRSVQTITLGTSLTSGVVHLVAMRPITFIGVPSATAGVSARPDSDLFSCGFAQLYDNSVLQTCAVTMSNGNAFHIGQLTFTQG